MKDLLGKALLTYFYDKNTENLLTETSISEADELPLSYFYRGFEQMPLLEKIALEQASGTVLDIGAGAGSHSLYLFKEKKLDVTSIDISEGACKVCQLRGLEKVFQKDFFSIKDQKFDTLLLLMNGTGICGSYKKLPLFLKKLKQLLNKGGQILIDSSDIIYMFDEDEDGGRWIPSNTEYYGELTFKLQFQGETSKAFKWLYLDFNTLKNACKLQNMHCELIANGENYDYLARITSIE
ncbi:class I SAM-dependent methyltransferase [Ascidiimonas sp. W6]|uniref:class I SAM-dependent methyltransferase n=1 Tax=Ascidiimonas meishanensis TaxID=3128903 RepID=UPI0030EDA093